MTKKDQKSLGVLTSGGDSQGMNAAVRAVVRAALHYGVDVYAIYEGYQGMIAGGEYIRKMDWGSVSGIIQQGGTAIGSARSAEFRTREGRLKAAKNLVERGMNRLVVIGGDGSLTGANLFREEWPGLLTELVEKREISQKQANAYPQLIMVGLVGSIDNDMFGTDMTIGADTALNRIVEAVDAITSTAASHQRTFVVEVMGRHCGYLAMMSAIATGANWMFIPEHPPEADDWEEVMCRVLQAGRNAGRRHSIVFVAEGAIDRHGNPISSEYVQQVLKERLGEDTRVTILGHVQRGGAPSAFDRCQSTILGYAAVREMMTATVEDTPRLIGIKHHDVVREPLMDNVVKTHQVAKVIEAKDYDQALALRGGSFTESFNIYHTIMQAHPRAPKRRQQQLRLLVLHAGGPAPGMNTAARVAIRLGMDKGHKMLAAQNGFAGLAAGDVTPMEWMSVHGWVSRGGAELGTSRQVPRKRDFYRIAEQLKAHKIDGLLMIGGWAGYEAANRLYKRRDDLPPLNIPMVCLPASINNNLPGTEVSIGADTALNSIITDVDKIKQSAVATRRCFVVEVMGHDSGYLALMSGLATGAERVYLPEEGISLKDLQSDVSKLIDDFKQGNRLGLIIYSENADKFYSTDFICSLFEKEGLGVFDVRQVILGHVQQGGNPSPFDRILATRLAARCIDFLIAEAEAGKRDPTAVLMGVLGGQVHFTNLARFPDLIEADYQRPKDQPWLRIRPIARAMAKLG